jgi:alpha-methylacyl-CoA racemase
MLLGDLGADVVQVQRGDAAPPGAGNSDAMLRSRQCITLNLKDHKHRTVALEMATAADVVLEGFRPGTAERLGLGPDECTARNPRLVYARMTGWGQKGPLARQAGHDINYIGLTGALHAIGPADRPPPPPLNLVGDFGGGSMFLVLGASLLLQAVWGWRSTGYWTDERESNMLDGAAPYYRCYACADARFVAVGAIEPAFYANLLKGLGLAGETLPDQNDRDAWPRIADRFATVFATRTRDEWVAVFAGLDACVSPVLSFGEAVRHPHMSARNAFTVMDGAHQPAVAPRFSRTPSMPTAPVQSDDPASALRRWQADATKLGAASEGTAISRYLAGAYNPVTPQRGIEQARASRVSRRRCLARCPAGPVRPCAVRPSAAVTALRAPGRRRMCRARPVR